VVLLTLFVLSRYKLGFGVRVLFALFVGLLTGVGLGRYVLETNLALVGQIYVRLARMLVMPLVVASVLKAIVSLKSRLRLLRTVLLRTVLLVSSSTALAALVGLLTALWMNPGAGIAEGEGFESGDVPTLTKLILDWVPENHVVELASGRLLPVMIIVILATFAAIRETQGRPKEAAAFASFVDFLSRMASRVTEWIVQLTPYGVFGFAAGMGARYGNTVIKPLGPFLLAICTASAIHLFLVLGGLIWGLARINPLAFFLRLLPAFATAFTTRSGYATLPLHQTLLIKRAHISPRLAGLLTPLGTAFNLNGYCGIYPAVATVFVAGVYGVQLGIVQGLQIVLLAAGVSLLLAGATRTASVSAIIMLGVLGLPAEGLALLLGAEVLADMALSIVNVAGAAATTLVVANAEGEFDRGQFLRKRVR
jgi:Na+/H+-dicarboxylate symporter